MRDQAAAVAAMSRAGRRAAYHLLQAAVEGLKAVEAVMEELGGLKDRPDLDETSTVSQKIEIE